jgi:hypothetical protein
MKNIFVYDQKKYFFLFLKRKYSKDFNWHKLKEADLFKIENFNSEDLFIFIVYSNTDILAIFNLIDSFDKKTFDKKRILICSDKFDMVEKCYKLLKIKSLDISKPKNFFYNELDLKLQKMIKLKYT